MPFYRFTRSGLTVGNMVYREGNVIEVTEGASGPRSTKVFAKQVLAGEFSDYLEQVDGRSNDAKGNLVSLPMSSGMHGAGSAGASAPDAGKAPEPQATEPQAAENEQEAQEASAEPQSTPAAAEPAEKKEDDDNTPKASTSRQGTKKDEEKK